MTTYHIGITDELGLDHADAFGDIDVINYVGKRTFGGLSSDAVVTVKLIETDGIGGDQTRTVLTITADGETAGVMLKRKITTERKASAPAETAEVEDSRTDASYV